MNRYDHPARSPTAMKNPQPLRDGYGRQRKIIENSITQSNKNNQIKI